MNLQIEIFIIEGSVHIDDLEDFFKKIGFLK